MSNMSTNVNSEIESKENETLKSESNNSVILKNNNKVKSKNKKSFFNFFKFNKSSSDIGIDLGTSNTSIYIKKQGIILREPTVVAINKATDEILAIGTDAKNMIGRTPKNILIVNPIQDGVIADFYITRQFLMHLIRRVGKELFLKPTVAICTPFDVTEVEKRAIEDAVMQAGAKTVHIIEEPMAAAIGAGLNIAEPEGSMIINIGGGTTEIATISLGGIVNCESVKIGGNHIDESIIAYMKKNYNLLIGKRTAEKIKTEIGSLSHSFNEKINITGRSVITGLPETISISSNDIRQPLDSVVSNIISGIKANLEKTPPELSSDIMLTGITLTGGGVLLKGLKELIATSTKMPVEIAENPLDCVVLGTGKSIEDAKVLNKILSLKN